MGEAEINAFLTHLAEALRLRVKDVDFSYDQITVRDGKGAKDRATVLRWPAGSTPSRGTATRPGCS